MKRIRGFSLLIPVLVLLASAYPAFAFCNPGTGQWLSRDPIGVKDGPKEYTFVRNNPIKQIDAHGTATVALPCREEVIRNVPEEAMPIVPGTSKRGEGVCNARFDSSSYTWSPCMRGLIPGRKIAGFNSACTITISIRKGVADNSKLFSGRTILEHEQTHGRHFAEHFADYVDFVRPLIGRCLCGGCSDAVQNYMEALFDYERITVRYLDWATEVDDYPPGDARNFAQNQLIPTANEQDAARIRSRDLEQKMNKVCGWKQ